LANRRRCMVVGCDCRGYAFDKDTYQVSEVDIVESEQDELRAFCSICGDAEEEHELGPTNQQSPFYRLTEARLSESDRCSGIVPEAPPAGRQKQASWWQASGVGRRARCFT
jgi:hypothetical protein